MSVAFLFNFPCCDYKQTRNHKPSCCPTCDLLTETWGNGGILLGTLSPHSSAYVAGYISKKYTHAQNYQTRLAPFARMSLRPAIGIGMMHELASTLLTLDLKEKMVDVPTTLQHGTSKWPLGRFLRRKLRTYIGRSPNAPQETITSQETELHLMRQIAWANKTSLKTEILEASLGKRIQIEAKQRRLSREKA